MEEGHEATVIAESGILSNLSKPNIFVPTQLLTLQDAKVKYGCTDLAQPGACKKAPFFLRKAG